MYVAKPLYRHVSRGEVIDALVHMRDLFRMETPSNEAERRAAERREASMTVLLSNLPRTSDHPTLTTLHEIANICVLTLEGVHRLFGYQLDQFQAYDLRLNGGRTHIFESYPFQRDAPIDLPAKLSQRAIFSRNAELRELVPTWQTSVPTRSLEDAAWRKAGVFYVHVGTEDSLGSAIPAGAVAMVEPISKQEATRPDTRAIYLLQFPNGYRCSHCVVSGGKLRPFNPNRAYFAREVFTYPGAVRIAGRVRLFALRLPSPDIRSARCLLSDPEQN